MFSLRNDKNEDVTNQMLFIKSKDYNDLILERDDLYKRLSDCESALISMVYQYCNRYDKPGIFSHDFMSAGEEAFDYLTKHNLAFYTENGSDITFPDPQEAAA